MQSLTAVPMHLIYGIFAGLTFIVVTLPTLLLVAVVPGRQRRRRIVKASATLLFSLIGARPRVAGLENLPDDACVAVANHASYLDGMILTAVLPPRFTFVIKREMTRVPLASLMLRRIGSEFVERFDRSKGASDAHRIVGHARRGESLGFFPEGTFRVEPGLRRFHNGAFVAAARGRLPVVPIVIRGSRAMLPAHQWLARPGRIDVRIKPPIDIAGTDFSVREIRRRARDSILVDLGEPDLA
jgi:1-acyl-sn-glycerol-3-phosphate acyltransferase